MDTSALAELFQTLGDLRSYHSGTVAALALLGYDIFIMMDQEVQHIWMARWSSYCKGPLYSLSFPWNIHSSS
ncbi:hypothetical protein CALCODRAFT_503279 [Calocera cornea HHB12733]|uniref:DUF6533 domain-containing protein n=1 Tax=Calocera cornea HHB12733 TaxID=1353952 RepID=A0A165CY83_9BASI|nr:hypothetical protein CALCODRAFT_503279 [Calocera cornea HHB12733]